MNFLATIKDNFNKLINKNTTKVEVILREYTTEDGQEYITETFVSKRLLSDKDKSNIIPLNNQSNYIQPNQNNPILLEDKKSINNENDLPDLSKLLRNKKYI